MVLDGQFMPNSGCLHLSGCTGLWALGLSVYLGLSGFPEGLGLPLMGLKGFGDPFIRPLGKMLYSFSVLQLCKDLHFVLFLLWRVRVEVSSWYLLPHQSPQNLVVRPLRKPVKLRRRMLPRAR